MGFKELIIDTDVPHTGRDSDEKMVPNWIEHMQACVFNFIGSLASPCFIIEPIFKIGFKLHICSALVCL